MLRTWFKIVRRRTRRPAGRRNKSERLHYLEHREYARVLIHERLLHWSTKLSLTHNRVAIRSQTTRWGSCSKKGNLNFNYRIAFLSRELMDYVIVHELCHLRHFNHSSNFWNSVGLVLPEYQRLRAELKVTPIQNAIPALLSVVQTSV